MYHLQETEGGKNKIKMKFRDLHEGSRQALIMLGRFTRSTKQWTLPTKTSKTLLAYDQMSVAPVRFFVFVLRIPSSPEWSSR